MPPLTGAVLNWHSLVARHAKGLRSAFQKVARAVDAHLAGRPPAQLDAVLVRNTPKQPLHPLARIRQGQSRWFSTARRHFSSPSSSAASPARYDRSSFPKSRVSAYINQSTGRAPFASTLRPNLTGGTLGRTAGGYSLGSGRVGGARFFSHGPASQAQVVQNVSQAMRAFFISGQKAQFDGVSSHTGEKRYKTVSTLQKETGQKMRSIPRATPGSWIDFQVNPTITALTPLSSLAGFDSDCIQSAHHINSEGLLDILSVDFSRALKDLTAVLNDLKRLSALGDLPITYQTSSLRIHFPGCDADTVERLCEELNVQRGTVVQDPAFDSFTGTEMALLFPYAPSEDPSDSASLFEMPIKHKPGPLISLDDMLTPFDSPDECSNYSDYSECSDIEDIIIENPWLSSPSAYQSVRSGSQSASDHSPLEYQGLEGIYKFIEQCDSARR